MRNITSYVYIPAIANIPDMTKEQKVAFIESLFYELYHVVAGEHGNPEDTCYAITSVHADLIAIAKGEL